MYSSFLKFWPTMAKNCSKIAVIRLLAGETSRYRICEQNIQFKILKLHITGYELVSNSYTSFEMSKTDYVLNVEPQLWKMIQQWS